MEREFKTGSVRANGLQFSYIEAGTGPLVLCLHGFPDNAYTFYKQIPIIAEAGYRVVAPFLRGYAPTEAPESGYQTAVLAQDTVALIEALGHDEGILLGHDWGATLALGAASIAADKIPKMITIAVPHVTPLINAFVTNLDQQQRSWYMYFFQLPFAEQAVALNDCAFIERIWQDWSPGWDYPGEVMASVLETFRQPGVVHNALNYYRYLFNSGLHDPELTEVQESLYTVVCPVQTLYFHGSADGCIGVELTEGMEEFFSTGFRKCVYPNVGHWVHQEAAEEVNREILQFLA